jgi:cell division protein FtsX
VNLDQNENGFLRQKERIGKIQQITEGISRGVVAVRTLFFIIAVLIIVNTLQIVIAHHREEIDIMQVVGAPHAIIMGPFIIEGVVYAVLGVLLGTGVYLFSLQMIQAKILVYLPQTALHPFFSVLVNHYSSEFFRILLSNILWFSLIGVVASLIALSYLVTFLPIQWVLAVKRAMRFSKTRGTVA